MPATLKMVIFASKDCSACKHLKKNVLPLFMKAHPNLKIEEVNIGLDKPSKDSEAEARADAYGVQALPTIVFELECSGLPRGSAGDCSLPGLNALLKKAESALAGEPTP
jgi:thiol-disulfide isomerase/thioredoxin